MTRLVTIVLLLGGLLLTGCSAGTTDSSGTQSADGSSAASLEFNATTISGDPFAGESLSGKPTVLWFWAPWCSACRNQAPGVSELATTYGDEVNVVGVGSLDESAAIEEFADAVPADFTQLDDPDGAVWRHFGVTAQSTYLVLDADQNVVASGYLSDADLDSTVAGLAGLAG
ncbi:TlpA family protein disulfide reductase [Nocardioides sp.]|uniref:TlpA family protein disulfide reductase n=1 Tax=Nocardioides sp. TaxID=35761 RepID=UPI002B26ED9C|nr:redoxin domain-containing protein [Nocardioides sp.]